jgi:hypothetical protein
MRATRSAAIVLVTLTTCQLASGSATAWTIGSQLDTSGCHERITAQALRDARSQGAELPVIAPTDDERALIADVEFVPPADLRGDLGGMALLLGVRDNDLHGVDPLASLDLEQVHGNPANQDEHCLRSDTQDGSAGAQAALDACIAFIVGTASAGLDGLDASGHIAPDIRTALHFYVSIAGSVRPRLPLFDVRMGQAMHALQDGFSHTYRSDDGIRVTTVLNWVDLVSGTLVEGRDGPPHLKALDQCDNPDPLVQRNRQLATQASTELLLAALDPGLDRAAKTARFGDIARKYLAFQDGCSANNAWCDAREPEVAAQGGCAIAPGAQRTPGLLLLLGATLLVVILLGRGGPGRPGGIGLMSLLLLAIAGPVRADAVTEHKEPGRDVATPTPAEIAAVREDKQLGSRWGFELDAGAAFDRPAMAISAGGR